jgi:uncharacterized DUF497 family protein
VVGEERDREVPPYPDSQSSKIRLDSTLFLPYIVHMSTMEFTWDNKKNKANAKKHNVSFEEARTAFFDEQAIAFPDPDHSEEEDRFILLGISFKLRVLVVCHCFRESETVVRIISARKADKAEERDYWRRRS